MSRRRRNRPSSARARTKRREDAQQAEREVTRLRNDRRRQALKREWCQSLPQIDVKITLAPFADSLRCGWCEADRYSRHTGRCPRCNQPVAWVQPFAFADDRSVFAWVQVTEGSCPPHRTPWPFDERGRWDRRHDEGETVEQARVRCSAVGILVAEALEVRDHDPQSRLELPDGFEPDGT